MCKLLAAAACHIRLVTEHMSAMLAVPGLVRDLHWVAVPTV